MRRTQLAIRLDPDVVEALQVRADTAAIPVPRAAMARWLLRQALGLAPEPPAAPAPRPEPVPEPGDAMVELAAAVGRQPPARPRKTAPPAPAPGSSPRDVPGTATHCGRDRCRQRWLHCRCTDKETRMALAQGRTPPAPGGAW